MVGAKRRGEEGRGRGRGWWLHNSWNLKAIHLFREVKVV
jgi:hypothetical protein